jgi:hypothetical protein
MNSNANDQTGYGLMTSDNPRSAKPMESESFIDGTPPSIAITGIDGLQASTDYRHRRITGIVGLQASTDYRHRRITGIDGLQASTDYRHRRITGSNGSKAATNHRQQRMVRIFS